MHQRLELSRTSLAGPLKDHASKGKTAGMALRVPTIDVSAFDPTAEITKQTTWKRAAQRRNAAQRHERLPRLN